MYREIESRGINQSFSYFDNLAILFLILVLIFRTLTVIVNDISCVGGHRCKTNEFSREEQLTIITLLQIINLAQTIRLKN